MKLIFLSLFFSAICSGLFSQNLPLPGTKPVTLPLSGHVSGQGTVKSADDLTLNRVFPAFHNIGFYSKIPAKQVSPIDSIWGVVYNNGVNSQTGINFNLSISIPSATVFNAWTDISINDSNQLSPAAIDTYIVQGPFFPNPVCGTVYTVTGNMIQNEQDANIADNTRSCSFQITDTSMARHTSISSHIGLNEIPSAASGDFIGNVFMLNPDTVSSFSFHLSPGATVNGYNYVKAQLYKFNPQTFSFDLVLESAPKIITAGMTGSEVTIPYIVNGMSEYIDTGMYIAGIECHFNNIVTDLMPLGFDDDIIHDYCFSTYLRMGSAPDWYYLIDGVFAATLNFKNAVSCPYSCGISMPQNQSVCPGNCLNLAPIIIGDTAITQYAWSTGAVSSGITVCPVTDTTYTLSITNGTCTSSGTVHVSVVPDCNTISGYVYYDSDEDGTMDAGENPVSGKIVQLLPGPQYLTSDSSGHYSFLVNSGQYSLRIPSQLNYITITPASLDINISGTGQSDSLNNFGIYSLSCPDLKVMAVNTVLSPGFPADYYILVTNQGIISQNGQLKYLPASGLEFLQSDIPVDVVSGDTLIWNFSSIAPGDLREVGLMFRLDSLVSIGTVLKDYFWVLPNAGDCYVENNSDSLVSEVTGSFDPNDKAVLPSGSLHPDSVAAGVNMVYTIRFQNTGTAPAANIRIIDTLSTNLDVSTFEYLGASHPCQWSLTGPGIVTWRFTNIMLPDSGSNEPESHGFVKFKIKPCQSLNVGEEIMNNAAIYFDFNSPVITNTVSSKIELPVITTIKGPATEYQALVYPNPFSNSTRIAFLNENHYAYRFIVSDIYGRIVYSRKNISTAEFSFENTDLKPGIYFYRLQGEKLYSGKLIVE